MSLSLISKVNSLKRKRAERSKQRPKPVATRNILSFKEFVKQVNPKYKWSEMGDRLARVLQRVADGELKRVMIFIPPRHGKSEMVSRLFSAYYLYRYPDRWVGINSYAAELAFTFSRAARDNYKRIGGTLSDVSSAVNHWETPEGGGCWAAGVGGPITGKGFYLGLIDDPLKNFEEASSQTIRDKQKDWYESTFYTRGEEDAAIVILQTRWHVDDLSGWLLKKEDEDEPEGWHIVCMEAIKEETEQKFPESCTVEPDWRLPGEPLNPVRRSLKWLLKTQRRIASHFWQSLYQQRPRPREGGLIKVAWVKRYNAPPAKFDRIIQSWDTASKASELNCPWSGTTWGIVDGNYYLLDVHTERHEYPDGERAVVNFALKWSPNGILIEDKSTGTTLLQELRQGVVHNGRKHFFSLIPLTPHNDKLMRMSIEAIAFESGRVYLPEYAPWLSDYESVLFDFPASIISDPIDSTSQFLRWIREGGTSNRTDISGIGSRSSARVSGY